MENNTTIMNAVRLVATDDYQQRIPVADQSNIAQISKALFEPFNRPLLNQFMSIFINKIAYSYVHNKVFDNPFSVFKRQPLEYGQTVQEAALKFIQAHSYKDDWGTRADDIENLLKVHRPDGSVAYHTVNREDTYPISINTMELRAAFNSEYGLNNLIAAIMQVPYNSDNYDEYRIFLELLSHYELHHGFFKQQISAVTNEATAKEFLKQVRTYAGLLRFPSSLYNALSVQDIPVWINADEQDELLLITTPDVLASIDVDALAALFNVDKAELKYRTLIVDRIPIDDAVALLTTSDFFVCADYAYETTSFFNAQTLTENFYLHHLGMYSVSPFVPAILFTTAEGTVIPTATFTPEKLEIIDPATDESTKEILFYAQDGGPVRLIDETVEGGLVDEIKIPLSINFSGQIVPNPLDAITDNIKVAPQSVTWNIYTDVEFEDPGEVLPVVHLSPVLQPYKVWIGADNIIHIKSDAIMYYKPLPDMADDYTFVAQAFIFQGTSTYINPDGTTDEFSAEFVVQAVLD